jgi:hypothetical protein
VTDAAKSLWRLLLLPLMETIKKSTYLGPAEKVERCFN